MSIEPDDKRLRFVPLEQATMPPAGLIEHFKDRWWAVHPDRGVVFFHESAQCNANKEVACRIVGNLYPWAELRHIPSVFRRINPHDYC